MLSLNRLNYFKFSLTKFINFLGNPHNSVIILLLYIFFFLRMPFIFNSVLLVIVIVNIVFPLFLSTLVNRVFLNFSELISSFLPLNTPIFIAPFICIIEFISYLIRPLVLMLRPILNLTIGSLGGSSLGLICINNNSVLLLLFILFFYEVFVAIIHWYIVNKIIDFSVSH